MIAKALREFIRVSQGKIVVGISAFEGQEDAGIVHSPEVDAPRLPIVKQTREWWTQMFEDVGLHPDRDMWQSFNQSLESLGPDWKTRQGASGEWFALQFVGGALAQVTAPGAGERSSGDTPLTMKYDALGLYADTSPITEAAPAPSGQQGKLEKQRKKEAKEEEDRARMEKGGPPPGFSAEDWSSYLKRAAYGELEHQSKRKHLEVMRVRATRCGCARTNHRVHARRGRHRRARDLHAGRRSIARNRASPPPRRNGRRPRRRRRRRHGVRAVRERSAREGARGWRDALLRRRVRRGMRARASRELP